MSLDLSADAVPATQDDLSITIVPRIRDLGGFEVARVLPYKDRRMVGPFIFFDRIGPADMAAGKAVDVRPHPHIGLATVTYLFDGALRHKDSLGTDLVIEPGAVNWMVSGKAITHSERTPSPMRETGHILNGIQTWVALPKAHEEMDPAFAHAPKTDLPVLEDGGIRTRIILGSAYGASVPVRVYSDTLYADVQLAPGTVLPLPKEHEDRAVYVMEGDVHVGEGVIEPGQMAVFRQGRDLSVRAGERGARLILCGGEVADGPRYISWNFVSSSKERLEQAKEDWKKADWENGPFTLPPTDRDEFIPLD